MREAEIKHSRIAMLATLGYVAVDFGVVAPGAPSGFSSLTAHDMAVEKGGMVMLLILASAFETIALFATMQMLNGETDRKPGQFYFDPLGFGKPADMAKLQVNEIKNGRLAMIAFSGIVTQAAMTGKGFPYMY
jgi:hypothetical protein